MEIRERKESVVLVAILLVSMVSARYGAALADREDDRIASLRGRGGVHEGGEGG